jgi:uncharacterized protein (DUF433 family)
MTTALSQEPAIVRTERGLTIVGTRIALYDLIDFLKAQYPPKLIRDKFNLTDSQLDAALSYINANPAQVEAEYQEVLKTREEIRQYWEDRNRQYFAYLANKTRQPDREVLWAKLEEQKAQRVALKL